MARLVDGDGVSHGDGWEGTIRKPASYYEGSGMVDGHPWYLHARGWRWSVAIAAPSDDPVAVVFGEVAGYYHEEAHPDPASMSQDEVWACAMQCLEEFRAVGFNVEPGEVHDPVLRAFEAIGR